jgi:hypothetical protein
MPLPLQLDRPQRLDDALPSLDKPWAHRQENRQPERLLVVFQRWNEAAPRSGVGLNPSLASPACCPLGKLTDGQFIGLQQQWFYRLKGGGAGIEHRDP